MTRVMDWWMAHQDDKPPNSKDFDNDIKKAMKMHRVLEKYDRVELGAEKKAKELQDLVKRNN